MLGENIAAEEGQGAGDKGQIVKPPTPPPMDLSNFILPKTWKVAT